MLFKEENYFKYVRSELVDLIHHGNNRVLEIGCGVGATSKSIKDQGRAEEVVGVEIVSEIAEQARDRLDQIYCGDIEKIELPYEEYFDYIVAGDVLEHLYDPWKTLEKIGKYLKKEGVFITSIPSVRNFNLLKSLIFKGTWEYTEAGLLDFTHIRFFTKKTAIKLFQRAGFSQIEVIPILSIRRIKRIVNLITFRVFEELLINQFIVKARKL